jgi:ABC-type Co2+ transport system permease subunit
MIDAFAAKPSLRTASRLPNLSRAAQISAKEIACLLACGAFAVLLVGFIHIPLRMPGHAILNGVLPMSLGMALVPRRSGGIVMAMGAGLTAAAVNWAGLGRFQPAAVLSILALGPVLDVATARCPQGWLLYARFATAGAIANLLAFAVRVGASLLGWDLSGSRQFTAFWSMALVSFILCGAAAGLVSAVIWFRVRVDHDDLRRD